MNTKNIIAISLLAGALAVTASAQVNVASGDLLLGIRQTGTLATSDLVVDLGQASALVSGTQSALSTLDIAAINSAWNSSSNANTIQWSVLGLSSSGNLWATTSNSQAPIAKVGNSFSGSFNGLTTSWSGSDATVNSQHAFNTDTLTNNAGWTQSMTANGTKLAGPYWGNTFDYSSNIEASAVGTSSLKLYDVTGNHLLGTFTLSSSGLTYSAIPEPSTYAAIFGALTMGFVAVRRRFASKQLMA